MPKTIRYEVVHPERCSSCDLLIGQTSKTRAWLMPPPDKCERCDAEIAALMLRAFHEDLQVIHVMADHGR